MPERIQLKRKKGWKMPENTVKVDRSTKWGNPFVPGKPIPFGPLKGRVVADKRHAFVLYRSFAPINEKLVAAAKKELAGKNLACWCAKDDPYEDACHAAVLLELANIRLTGEAYIGTTFAKKRSHIVATHPAKGVTIAESS
ncbi:MAG: DUF4326 domain-containing protein [Candidatus Contendobacter sp.]